MTDRAFDLACMREALALAQPGRAFTSPNPSVGCLLARGRQVVGRGATERAGGAHAEVNALREAGDAARGSTAYVTLEPCSHHCRTPPCADALVTAGVSRVVVATLDPFPQVSGQGIARLRAAGIEVDVGLCAEPARRTNRGFFARHIRGRPFTRLKLATSVDGRTAMPDGSSRWITGPAARRDVQRLRASSCAIVTGVGSILADDSRLSVRAGELPAGFDYEAPLKVILDSRLRTPADARALQGAPAVVVTAGATRAEFPVEIVALPDRDGRRVDLAALLDWLAARGVNEALFECGAELAGALLDAGLVDELVTYVAGVVLGDRARAAFVSAPPDLPGAPRFELLEVARVGTDARLTWRPVGTMPD